MKTKLKPLIITIEVELDVSSYYESTDCAVELGTVRFPGCSQNLLPFLSDDEKAAAQQALEEAVEQRLQGKIFTLRELQERRHDRG